MMICKCTEDRFLGDVKNHTMEVKRADGVYRHLSFTNKGSSVYQFDLHTWPGELCITGDMGTYVFCRTHDMLEFFRESCEDPIVGPLYIHPGYWGEKLTSIGVNEGYKKFSEELFKERITEQFHDWKESEDPTAEQAEELWEQITEDVLSWAEYGEHDAYNAAGDFQHKGFRFQDFFDSGATEDYTFHFIWCLYAIAWGVRQYDARKDMSAS